MIGDIPDCVIPQQDLRFKSMGDVKRAGKALVKDSMDIEAEDVINSYRYFRACCLNTSLNLLQQAGLPEKILISARLKRLKSLRRKLLRPSTTGGAHDMDDITGFRIICDSLTQGKKIAKNLETKLGANIKNYLDGDHGKGIGYRAIHCIVRFDQPFKESSVKVRFEVQVRTWKQHLWASECERHSEQAKEGFSGRDDEETRKIKEKFLSKSNEIKQWENANPDEKQETLPDFTTTRHLGIARSISSGNHRSFSFDTFSNNITEALGFLQHYEENFPNQEILLLVGYTGDEDELKKLLTQTHPKFFYY